MAAVTFGTRTRAMLKNFAKRGGGAGTNPNACITVTTLSEAAKKPQLFVVEVTDNRFCYKLKGFSLGHLRCTWLFTNLFMQSGSTYGSE